MTASQPNGTPAAASQAAGVPARDDVDSVPDGSDTEWYTQVEALEDRLAFAGPELGAWGERAEELLNLLIAAGIARGVATRTHAQAWLACDGCAGVQREQVAKLRAAGATLAADVARARVDAYRLLLDAWRVEDLAPPVPPAPPVPRPAYLDGVITTAEIDDAQQAAARHLDMTGHGSLAAVAPAAADVMMRLLAIVEHTYGPPAGQQGSQWVS